MDFDGQRICGVADAMGAEQVCAYPRGNPTRIGWYLTGIPPSLDIDSAGNAYRTAWEGWSKVCGIEAVYFDRSSEAMGAYNAGLLHGLVVIGAGHIDGPSGTLAWSELPCGTRRCKQQYDTGEKWIVHLHPGPPPSNRIDLVRVAMHEIGHAIGISHIAAGNLLQPTYSTVIGTPQGGDIAEAVKRYGPPVAKPAPQPTPTPAPAPAPTPGGGFMGALGGLLDILNKLKPLLDLWNDPAFQEVLAKILKLFGDKKALTADDVAALQAELGQQVQAMKAP